MKVELRVAYEVIEPDEALKQRADTVMEDEIASFLGRLHGRFAAEGFDVERFESSRSESSPEN